MNNTFKRIKYACREDYCTRLLVSKCHKSGLKLSALRHIDSVKKRDN